MTRIAKIAVFGLALGAAAPGFAGEGVGDVEEGFDLLGEATRLILRGLMKEMEPGLQELEDVLRHLDAYEAPEILPNGDIIIRRKVPLVPEEEIEL